MTDVASRPPQSVIFALRALAVMMAMLIVVWGAYLVVDAHSGLLLRAAPYAATFAAGYLVRRFIEVRYVGGGPE